ncbi:cell division protein FtsN [Thalassotalea insulae]|uniref:Cell division protein FtsN n=1 Tax=Thalassotalea insulae TaxID=2056778 RepID=A0ABQ6GRN6_9GAMM|nr:SPOR domain-containing protein [Thalassotalea insulae]GLX78067.1 cell division protein FtsN [Thalassotalea insulae]
MAHQDYISRANSPKKKHNPYKKTAETPAGIPIKLKIILLFLVIAISAFGYFLWSIKDIKPTAPSATQPAKQAQQDSKLPKPPEEKWQYMEELKSKEVDVGEYAVEEKGPYKMQCGSFRTRKQAEVMKATIAFSGLSSQISSATGSSGTWHKVYLGPYPRKRAAEKDKHKLKSNGITTCQIWLWK